MNKLIHNLRTNTILKKTLEAFVKIMSLVYLFFIPSFSARYPFNYIGYVLFGILTIIVFIYIYLYDKFIIKTEFLFLPIFGVLTFVSTLFGSHEFRRWMTTLIMTLSFLIMILIYKIIDDRKKMIKLFVIGMTLFSIYFVVIYFPELSNISNFSNMRLGDYFDNVNQVGFYFCFGAIFALYLALFGNSLRDKVYYFLFIIFLFLGFTTGSRTTLICLFVGVLGLFIIRFKDRKVMLSIILASLTISIVLLFNLPFMATLKDRFLSFFETIRGDDVEGSTIQRLLWQEYGYYFGLKNLFLGLGEYGFAVFSGVGTYTHGDFPEILCNFGIFGFCTYYGLFVFLGSRALQKRDKQSLFAIIIIILYLFLGFLGVNYYNKITPYILAIISCLSQDSHDYIKLNI